LSKANNQQIQGANDMNLTQVLFTLQGRITRKQFWLAYIGSAIVFDIIIFALFKIMGVTFDQYGQLALPPALWVAMAVLYIPMMWIFVCVWGKRCHDRDRSAWFLLIILIPIIGGIWLLIEAGFLDGTQGPNRFGPSPKGIGGNTVASVFS
jgi:uncharacterized membrane protein YhaH (DUF805 family)